MHVLVSHLENCLSYLVYIAGPYTADDRVQKNANINKAIEAALWCATNSVYYFCPHMNSAYMDELAPDVPAAFYYEMDRAILNRCDALLLISSWWNSKGAREELLHAARRNKKIFYFDAEQEEILKWYREEKK